MSLFFVRLSKELGRAVQWLDRARGTKSNRVVLEQYSVREVEDGGLGDGVVLTADGFRLHAVRGLNLGPDSRKDNSIEFDDRLTLVPGNYHFRAKVQAEDHINELVESGGTYPDVHAIIPSLDPHAKPYALIALNPQFLRDAMVNAGDTVLIRVYRSRSADENGSIACRQPVEVITIDKHSDLQRMAVIMPQHLGWNEDESREIKQGLGVDWPVAWTGEFPPKEEVKDDGNQNDS